MKVSLLSLAILLSACQGVGVQVSAGKSTEAAYEQIKNGSRLVLHQKLSIPPGKADIDFQFGKKVSSNSVDLYYPNCKLIMQSQLDRPQFIQPDTFVIKKVYEETEVVSLALPRLASAEQSVLTGNVIASHVSSVSFGMSTGDGGPIAENYLVELYLHSDKQPEVSKLRCQHWQDLVDGSHLNITEIRQTLGSVFSLNL